MKPLFFLLMTIAVTNFSYGQVTKCKYDVNEFDSFSGSRIVKTKGYVIGKTEKTNYDVDVAVRKVDSTYFLIIVGLAGDCVGSHDTEVSFKTVLGDIYTLKHLGDVDCGRSIYVGSGVTAKVPPLIVLPVTKDEIRTNAISMIRITQGQSYSNVKLILPMTLKQIFDCADNAPIAKKR